MPVRLCRSPAMTPNLRTLLFNSLGIGAHAMKYALLYLNVGLERQWSLLLKRPMRVHFEANSGAANTNDGPKQ